MTFRTVYLGRFAGPPLGALEEREHVVPAPAAIAELRPVVVVLGLTADVDLVLPTGNMAFYADGVLYISNFSAVSTPGTGQIVRIEVEPPAED